MIKIKYMRAIDFWIGIPLCFLLSVWEFVFGNIKNKKKCDYKKILFLELSEMGSAILAYPAMKQAKELFPCQELYFWIFHENRESVDALQFIHRENVISMRSDSFLNLIKDTVSNLIRIWKEDIDVVVDMELFSRFSAVLTYLSRAKVKAGFYRFCQEGLYRGALHNIKVQYNPHLHISANFMALARSIDKGDKDILLKEPVGQSRMELPLIKRNIEAESKVKSYLGDIKEGGRLIIMNPLTSELLPLRSWLIENYFLLAEKLLQDENNYIAMIGLESDSDERNKISDIAGKNKRYFDLIGKTNMKDLLALFAIAKLFISHDSGPVHFASLTNIEMIILFGPETPTCYAPLSPNATIMYSNFACSPCVSAYNHRVSPCKNNKCLQVLTVEAVYSLAIKALCKPHAASL